MITNHELNGGRELVNCFNIEVRDGQNKNQITKQKPKVKKQKQTYKQTKEEDGLRFDLNTYAIRDFF